MLCDEDEKILLPIILCATQIGLLAVSHIIKAQLIFMEHFSVQQPGLALSTHGLILPSRHWAVPPMGILACSSVLWEKVQEACSWTDRASLYRGGNGEGEG